MRQTHATGCANRRLPVCAATAHTGSKATPLHKPLPPSGGDKRQPAPARYIQPRTARTAPIHHRGTSSSHHPSPDFQLHPPAPHAQTSQPINGARSRWGKRNRCTAPPRPKHTNNPEKLPLQPKHRAGGRECTVAPRLSYARHSQAGLSISIKQCSSSNCCATWPATAGAP